MVFQFWKAKTNWFIFNGLNQARLRYRSCGNVTKHVTINNCIQSCNVCTVLNDNQKPFRCTRTQRCRNRQRYDLINRYLGFFIVAELSIKCIYSVFHCKTRSTHLHRNKDVTMPLVDMLLCRFICQIAWWRLAFWSFGLLPKKTQERKNMLEGPLRCS